MRPFIASFVTSHVEDSSKRPSSTVEAGLKPGPLYLNPLSDALHWISLYTATSRLVIVLLLLLVSSGKFVLKAKEIRGINLLSSHLLKVNHDHEKVTMIRKCTMSLSTK